MNQTKRFGTNPNGTLSECRAKEGNVGRYGCNHGTHIPVSSEQEMAAVNRHNEEVRAKEYGATSTLKKATVTKAKPAPKPMIMKDPSKSVVNNATNHKKDNANNDSSRAGNRVRRKRGTGNGNRNRGDVNFTQKRGRNDIPKVTSDAFSTHKGGKVLTRKQFDLSSQKTAQSFPEREWKNLSDVNRRLTKAAENNSKEKAIQSIKSFLESDDPDAKLMREYMGDDVKTSDVAEILVSEIHSMRSVGRWDPNKPTRALKRTIATTANNDMTKERYVASVMFFGGRCCYCNQPMSKKQGDSQATGEHITPVSARGAVTGGTRYGNMAVACRGCNGERGNLGMKEWLKKTNRLTPENKEACIQRIQAFRRYALYSEYTPEQSEAIDKATNDCESYIKGIQAKRENGVLTEDDANDIRKHIKVAIHDLNEILRD